MTLGDEATCDECPHEMQVLLTYGALLIFVIVVIVYTYKSASTSSDVSTFTIVTTHFQIMKVECMLSIPPPTSSSLTNSLTRRLPHRSS